MNRLPSSPSRQRGVSVITAIFFLLLFAALAALMANMISAAHSTAAEDVAGARAYQAARGGAEWGLYQVLDPANATALSATSALPGCFAAGTPVAGLGATVSVDCAAFGPYTEGSRNIGVYRITSTATIPGPGIVIERQVEITAEKCRDTASTVAPYDC